MTWLLVLYPPRWRRRYGEELCALIGTRPFSFASMVDVIAGAIDAWLDPQMMTAAQSAPDEEGEEMLGKAMKFRCAGYGPQITRADEWKSLGVMLGGTLVLTVGWMWLHFTMGDHPYVDAFSLMPFLAAMLLSMRYTYLKGRTWQTQAIFIGGSITMLTLLFGVVGWITARM